jgi:branched-chain amino acid transport system permease protein
MAVSPPTPVATSRPIPAETQGAAELVIDLEAPHKDRIELRFDGHWRLILVWLLLLLIPLLASNNFVVSLANAALINLILIASLNLLIGFGGQISLGHAGFFGLGAYGSGILNVKLGIDAWLGLPVAALVASLAALLIGIPALRLRGLYLSMATLGFNSILYVLFNRLVSVTGGPNGLLGVEPFSIFGWPLDNEIKAFPLIWLVSFLIMLSIQHLLRSRTGRALRAVATNELGAEAVGINSFHIKLLFFVLAAGMAGVAGSLYVHTNQYASPETFDISSSILLVVMVALGGSGNYWGPVAGTLVLTVVPQLLLDYQDAELMLFGLGMLIVLIVFPAGLAGVPEALVQHFKSRRP